MLRQMQYESVDRIIKKLKRTLAASMNFPVSHSRTTKEGTGVPVKHCSGFPRNQHAGRNAQNFDFGDQNASDAGFDSGGTVRGVLLERSHDMKSCMRPEI